MHTQKVPVFLPGASLVTLVSMGASSSPYVNTHQRNVLWCFGFTQHMLSEQPIIASLCNTSKTSKHDRVVLWALFPGLQDSQRKSW